MLGLKAGHAAADAWGKEPFPRSICVSVSDRAVDEQGMTLVEVMVALVIVGVVLSALASALGTTLRAVRGQEATTQATAAINDILEEVNRVDYDEAVLCTTTATTEFSGTTFEGENLVLSAAPCGASDEVLARRTVTRDGRDYDVRTAITWADDAADGLGTSADANGTQDIKRIVVDVSWASDGRPRSARNMAFRAPQSLDQLITAEVVADDGSAFITIADDVADNGENAEAFTLRAFAREKLSSVQVSWIDRTGATESHPMTAVNSDGLVWEYRLHSNFGPFANGGTLFDFDATSTTSETELVAARGLFLYDPMVVIPNNGVVVQRSFDTLSISSVDGTVCPGQAMWMDVEGAIRSDLSEAVWISGPPTTDPLVSIDAPNEVVLRGARFLLDLSGRTDFASYDSTTGTYSVRNGVVQVRIYVKRIVDGTSIEKELANINVQLVSSC